MTSKSACLFGGALLTAGITATAGAQTFSLLDTGSYGTGTFNTISSLGAGYYVGVPYSIGIDTTLDSVLADGDDLNQSITSIAGGTTVTSTVTDNILRYDATWDGDTSTGNAGSYFGGFLQTFFTVDQDADLELTWDMSNTDFFGPPGFFTIFSGGAIIPEGDFDVTAANPTGSAIVPLTAGTEYGVVLTAGSPFGFDTDTKFLQAELLVVPEPSLGLLSVAGLGLLGRRRRA